MRAKKSIYTHNVAKKTNYDDRITLNGARPTIVPQYDGEWPPFAEVLSSMSPERRPKDTTNTWDYHVLTMGNYEPLVFQTPAGQKWCNYHAHWVDRVHFGNDSRNRDGLKSYCKVCEAAEQRRRRVLERDSIELRKLWEERHISRLIPLQTERKRAA